MKKTKKNAIQKIALSEIATAETPKDKKGRQLATPPEPKPISARSLSKNSSEILDDIYSALGGQQGSVLYWRNHEEDFRNQIESKFLTKQVYKEAAAAQSSEVGRNVFAIFLQNNGLAKQTTSTDNSNAVEAQIVPDTPKLTQNEKKGVFGMIDTETEKK